MTGGDDASRSGATSLPQAETRAAVAGGSVVRTQAGAPERWYALGGDPALTNAHIASAVPITDQATGDPAVALEFTEEGKAAFSSLTRGIARRGAAQDPFQHLVIVLDGRIVSVPFIDYHEAPDGIDGSGGAMISGGLTSVTARQIAAILDSGPLLADLEPVRR